MPPSTLRVELPAYSRSFQVPVCPSATIHDVKREITKACPGSPSPEGQRLVWRGRFLKDEEKVEDVWKSPEDIQVIHLAVHPSAWTSSPPRVLQTEPSATLQSSPAALQGPPRRVPMPSPPRMPPFSHASPTPLPSLAYLHYLHSLSLSVLSGGSIELPTVPTVNELESWRASAQDLYRSRSWPWPAIYDEPFPSGSPEPGAIYQAVTLEGLPYLRLASPDATPTPAQLHALQVLSHTFSVLSMDHSSLMYAPPFSPYPPHSYAPPTNVNQRLQQLGLPPLRVAHNQGPNGNPVDGNPLGPQAAAAPEIRAIPLRALMVPLMMLAFRTLLLLYFFSPSKRPLFGIILSFWILYEAWNALHLVLHDGNDRGANGAADAGAPAGGPGQRGPAGPAGAAGPGPNVPGLRPPAGRANVSAVLDRLAAVNLSAEDALLEADAPAPSAPGVVQKARMFATLFLMTLYPAAWDRRRNALRRREGRIRTEANMRDAAMDERRAQEGQEGGEGQQQQQQSEEDAARARARLHMVERHERRPGWLKGYVERVQYTEWVDDP